MKTKITSNTTFVSIILIFLFPILSNAQSIAVGGRHSLAICSDSTVSAWGYNGYGQLGDGTILPQHTSVMVSGLSGIRQVAGGLFHSLFVKNDGSVWSCGRNVLGPLGDGTSTDRTTPVQVVGLSGVIQVSGGGEHSLFLKNDSTVWSCGANSSGQLGDGTTINRITAVQVTGLTGIIQVAAGAEFSLFLKSNGEVWACGHNGYGQFGNGTNISSNIPFKINTLSGIVQISSGEWHSIFVKNDGTVFSAGRNNYGQLGDGTIIDKNNAIQITTLYGIVKSDAGGIHSVFVKNDGTVWSCGLNSGGNNDGQLGDGTIIDRHTPIQVIPSWGTGKIIDAHAAREHSIYLLNNGQVWASGRNNYGQLGYGTFTTANSSTSLKASTVCSVLAVSINNKEEQIESSFSPNPFSSQTILQTKYILKDVTLTIYNSLGQQVKQINNISGQVITLHRDNLPSGLYFINLTENSKTITTDKIIITD